MLEELANILSKLREFLRKLVLALIILILVGAILFKLAVDDKRMGECRREYGPEWATISERTNLNGSVCVNARGERRRTTPPLSGGQR